MKRNRIVYLGLFLVLTIEGLIGKGYAAETPRTTLLKTPVLTKESREDYRLNLARTNLGAGIKSSRTTDLTKDILSNMLNEDSNQSPNGLISSDESISYPLPKGATSFIIRLPFLAAHQQFSFYGDNGCEGKVTLYRSNSELDFKSEKWIKITEAKSFQQQNFVVVDFPSTEFVVLKVDFEITKAGRVSGFGVFGETKTTGFEEKPEQVKNIQPLTEIVNYDYSGLNNNLSSITHVSSYKSEKELDSVNSMIDDNVGTYYSFDPNDPTPTLLVDLGLTEQIRRVTVVYKASPGILEYYLLNKLPEGVTESNDTNAQGPKLLQLPSDFYSKNSPIRTEPTVPTKLKSTASFDLQSLRYVLLRWIPNSSTQAQFQAPQDVRWLSASTNPISFIPPQMGQIVPTTNPSLIVMEINAFSNTRKRRYTPDRSRERNLYDTTNAEMLIPKDPPRIPTVSP